MGCKFFTSVLLDAERQGALGGDQEGGGLGSPRGYPRQVSSGNSAQGLPLVGNQAEDAQAGEIGR